MLLPSTSGHMILQNQDRNSRQFWIKLSPKVKKQNVKYDKQLPATHKNMPIKLGDDSTQTLEIKKDN